MTKKKKKKRRARRANKNQKREERRRGVKKDLDEKEGIVEGGERGRERRNGK